MSYLICDMLIISSHSNYLTHPFVICSLSVCLPLCSLHFSIILYTCCCSINTLHAEGETPQFKYCIEYFLQTPLSSQTPLLTFSPSLIIRTLSSEIWGLVFIRVKHICLSQCPQTLCHPCLVPRQPYAPPLLLLLSEFIGGTDSDTLSGPTWMVSMRCNAYLVNISGEHCKNFVVGTYFLLVLPKRSENPKDLGTDGTRLMPQLGGQYDSKWWDQLLQGQGTGLWGSSNQMTHQQIPCFGTVPIVITVIVQFVTALTAYIATGSQFHGNTVPTQHVMVCWPFSKFH